MKYFIFCVLINTVLIAQTKNPDEIINNVKSKFGTVQDYKVDLIIEVDMKFLRIPKVSASVYFKQPNKIKMESSDFAILPKEGINFSPISFLNEQYTSIYVREDTLAQINVDVIKIIPLSDSTNVILTTLWIDISNKVIKKVETTTKNRGTFIASLDYNEFIKYGLPSIMNFNFNIEDPELNKLMELDTPTENNPSKRSNDNFSGKIKVEYNNYKVNQGIEDSFFEEEEKKNVEK